MENIKTIKKYDLFKGFEENEISALLRCFNVKILTFKEKKPIVNAGEKILNLYLVLSGRARDTWYDQDGNINTYVDYKAGDFIGLEYAASNTKTHTSSIIALEETIVIALDSFRFLNPCQNYCPRHAKIINKAYAILAKQNQTLMNRIKELSMGSTKKKVLCYLNNIKNATKTSEFDIPYNREELANYLGVERSALSKELSDLQKQGFITYHKNHFTLLKTKKIGQK
jgi:CRP-like cAMP-binding protein